MINAYFISFVVYLSDITVTNYFLISSVLIIKRHIFVSGQRLLTFKQFFRFGQCWRKNGTTKDTVFDRIIVSTPGVIIPIAFLSSAKTFQSGLVICAKIRCVIGITGGTG